jgi:phage shock protein C
MSPKKLYKTESGKMIAGVCAGIAEYFNFDVSLVRIVFVLFGFTGGGILAYIIAAIILPDKSELNL